MKTQCFHAFSKDIDRHRESKNNYHPFWRGVYCSEKISMVQRFLDDKNTRPMIAFINKNIYRNIRIWQKLNLQKAS